MSDPGYRIVSARYANDNHTAVIAHTVEAGAVAASPKDRPALWARIHACGIPIAPHDRWTIPAPMTAPPAPEPIMLAPTAEPVPIPVSMPMQQTLLPPPPGSYVQTLLAKLPDEPWGDQERRETAKSRLRDAVLAASQVTVDDQMRYELACQALNKNMRAMELFEPEAKATGQSIEQLASRIYTERRTRERRMMHAHAVLARASGQIDRATGAQIDNLAEAGIQEIEAQQ